MRLTTLTLAAPSIAVTGRRRAFTLVEILVVIAIIVLLVALTSAALSKAVEGQRNRTTKEQLTKLQQSLDAEYDAVVEQCRADQRKPNGIPPEIVNYADGDRDRALAIWMACQTQRQFPQSFAEARTGTQVTDEIPPPNGPNVLFVLQPHQAFREVGGVGSSANPPAPHPDESAVLLYMILANKSASGGGALASAADELTQGRQVTIGGKPFTAFADAWGNSIGFRRWFGADPNDAAGAEVQTPEYYGSTNAFNPANFDPLDNRNLILGWPNTAKRNAIGGYFQFNGRNRLPTVYSSGKDQTLGTPDDMYGFRLKRHANIGGGTK